MVKALKDLIPSLFAKHDKWKLDLLRNWQTILGPLSSKAKIEKILNDTLVIGVFNSCWMQELYLLSPLLIKTINQSLDKPHIKQIRFKKKGTVKTKHLMLKQNTQMKILKELSLTAQQKKALESIKDPKLRTALEQFLKRCYREESR